MKRLAMLSLAASGLTAVAWFAASSVWSAPEPATYEGDTVHSFVLFKVKHMDVGSAYGRFNDFKVSAQVSEPRPEGCSVSFEVKAESVDTGNAKRDQHLRGPDFLNAKEFPDITFKSTGVKSLGKDGAEVTGDLTLHGVKRPVTVKVAKVGSGKDKKGAELIGFETTFTIKRSDFGMTNMIGPVSDEVTLTVAVEAARK